MRKLPLAALALACAGSSLLAQQEANEAKCATPDSVAVVGNKRVPSTTILLDAALTPGQQLNAPLVGRRKILRGPPTGSASSSYDDDPGRPSSSSG
jgi:hypothetical protein